MRRWGGGIKSRGWRVSSLGVVGSSRSSSRIGKMSILVEIVGGSKVRMRIKVLGVVMLVVGSSRSRSSSRLVWGCRVWLRMLRDCLLYMSQKATAVIIVVVVVVVAKVRRKMEEGEV